MQILLNTAALTFFDIPLSGLLCYVPCETKANLNNIVYF